MLTIVPGAFCLACARAQFNPARRDVNEPVSNEQIVVNVGGRNVAGLSSKKKNTNCNWLNQTYTSSRNKSKKPSLGLDAWFLKKQRVGYDPKAFWSQTKLEPNIRNSQSYPENCWSYLNRTLASLGIEIFTLWSTNLTPITPEDSSFESGPNVVKLVPEPNKAGHGGVGLLVVSSKMNPSTQNTKEWRKNDIMHFSLNGILSRLQDNREIHIWWK